MAEIANIIKIKMILDIMIKYQKENNIKRECVTNTQFLYRIIKSNFPVPVKVIPIIYISDFGIQSGHLVLEIEGMGFIECSYDMLDRLKTADVYKTIKECLANETFANNESKKMLIENVLHFQKIANRMNEGEIMISDFKYFQKLYACCEHIFE
jgi:hypothetical protein